MPTVLQLLCALSVAVASAALYYLSHQQKRDRRLVPGHGLLRRLWTPPTSPKLISPDVELTGYKYVFPPSRRHVLSELAVVDMKGLRQAGTGISHHPPYLTRSNSHKAKLDIAGLEDATTATGFTVEEIKCLGDFPDYAALSGVPLPKPHPNFDINTAMPRPYRPFRWVYHQTMSLTKMEHDWWLELDRDYIETIRCREALFAQHNSRVTQVLAGSELAAKELMEMCLQFLAARYPRYFRLDLSNMIFHNDILHTQTSIRSTPPMQVLLHNVPEDFAIMIRDPDNGLYSFRGGIVMSSVGWDLGSKIGLPLHEIHGRIPDYREKMQFSMDRYFARKPTDKPIQRGSWGLEKDKPLYVPPAEEHIRLQHDPALTIDRVHLRVDWQTLRRLPLSGAVVFNFKCLFTPVTEFRDEPYIPSLLLKILKEGKDSLMEYKGHHTDHVTIPALEQWEREQLQNGLIEKDWQPHTLDESPFFPGWEEKWHRQQRPN